MSIRIPVKLPRKWTSKRRKNSKGRRKRQARFNRTKSNCELVQCQIQSHQAGIKNCFYSLEHPRGSRIWRPRSSTPPRNNGLGALYHANQTPCLKKSFRSDHFQFPVIQFPDKERVVCIHIQLLIQDWVDHQEKPRAQWRTPAHPPAPLDSDSDNKRHRSNWPSFPINIIDVPDRFACPHRISRVPKRD